MEWKNFVGGCACEAVTIDVTSKETETGTSAVMDNDYNKVRLFDDKHQ